MEVEVRSWAGVFKFKSSQRFSQQTTEYVTINNFSEFSDGNCDVIRTSEISYNSTVCALKFYPNGNCAENEGYVSVEFVKHVGDPELYVLFNCVLSVLDNEGNLQFFQSFIHDSTDQQPAFGIDRFIKRSILLERSEEFLKNDRLSIRCEHTYTIKRGDPLTIWETDSDLSPFTIHNYDGAEEVDLDIETEEGKVYKLPLKKDLDLNQLCQKSRVFARMLNTAMSEKADMKVIIKDINQTTLINLLSYANANTFMTNSVQETFDLYVAADKYEILGLRDECASDLCHNMMAENVCNVLILADMHNDIKLRNTAVSFISANKDAVMESDSYLDLAENNHRLLQEIETATESSNINTDENDTLFSESNDEKSNFYM